MEKGLMWFLIHHSSQEYSFHKTNWSQATLQKYEHVYGIKQAKRNTLRTLERHRTRDQMFEAKRNKLKTLERYRTGDQTFEILFKNQNKVHPLERSDICIQIRPKTGTQI